MKVYNVQEVADILKVSIYTVKNLIRDKKLNPIKLGVTRISEDELSRFIRGE